MKTIWRLFYCFRGWHWWSQWSKPAVIEDENRFHQTHVQQRHCKACNVTENKLVNWVS